MIKTIMFTAASAFFYFNALAGGSYALAKDNPDIFATDAPAQPDAAAQASAATQGSEPATDIVIDDVSYAPDSVQQVVKDSLKKSGDQRRVGQYNY